MDTLSYCFLWLFSLNRIQKRPEHVCNSMCMLNHIRLFTTPWSVADHAPPSLGFSRQNTGVGCHALLQGLFPAQGSNLHLQHWQASSLSLRHLERKP